MPYTKQTWNNTPATDTPISGSRLANLEQGVFDAGNSTAGGVWLDDKQFDPTGTATDDQKLTAAMDYAKGETYPPAILLGNRSHTFSTQRVPGSASGNLYTGFRLIGPNRGITNAELDPENGACKVSLTTNGAWLSITGGGDVWNVVIAGITFLGTSNTTFIGGDSSTIFHGCHLRDLGFKSFKSVLGTLAQKLLMTTCLIDGYFQAQGVYNLVAHIGGSDNRLYMQGALVDASQAYASTGGVTGQAFFWFDGMDNSCVGPLYVTSTGVWASVKVTGVQYNATPTSNFGMLTFTGGLIMEGHNATDPCFGAVMRIEGGLVKIRDCYVGRAMSDPSAMGHSPQDAGVIHVTGGYLLLDGCTYGRATSVAETVPMVYQSGGNVRVLNASVATHGGTWSGLPRVQSTGGTINATDGTWTLV